MPPYNYGSSRRQKGSTANAKIHHAEASARRAQILNFPIEIRAHVSAFPAARLAGEPWLDVGQPDVIRPSVAAAPSPLLGLLFGARFHILGYLYAGEEIEIARRTQRASITFTSIPYGDRG
jgi:hypothetical protein